MQNSRLTNSTVQVWDTKTFEKVQTLPHAGAVETVAWSPDGKVLAAGTQGQRIHLWDAESGKPLHSIQGHLGWITKLAWHPKGRHLASAGFDGTIRIWDTETLGETCVALDPRDTIYDNPEGTRRVIRANNKSRVIDLATGDELCRFHDKSPHPYGWIAGTKLLVTHPRNGIAVLDSDTGEMVWEIPTTMHQGFGVRSFDNHFLVLSARAWLPNDTQVWDLTTGKLLYKHIGHTSNVLAMAISRDNKKLATSSASGDIKLWNLRTGELLRSLYGHVPNHWVGVLAWGRDHKLLASGGWDQSVKIWNAERGEILHSLEGHTSAISGVCFSPDNSRLLTVSSNGATKLWDVRTGRELLNLATPELTDKSYQIEWEGSAVTLARDGIPFRKLDASRGFALADGAHLLGDLATAKSMFTNERLLETIRVRDHNLLARDLIANPQSEYYNPKLALRTIEELLQQDPSDGNYWNLLAIVRYRTKDFDGAIEAAAKSDSLLKGAFFSYNGFFLAMAHAQLGNDSDAKQFFERAQTWMDQHAPNDEELQRYCEEAQRLLR